MICCIGFVLIVYNNENIYFSIYGIIASIFLTLNEIIIKFVGRSIDFMTLTVFEILVQFLLSLILMGCLEFNRI